MPKDSRAPPVLKDGGDYLKWKHELDAWCILTDVAVEKQALSVSLYGLEGKAKDLIGKLPIKDLHTTGGVKLITDGRTGHLLWY